MNRTYRGTKLVQNLLEIAVYYKRPEDLRNVIKCVKNISDETLEYFFKLQI